MFVKLRFKWHTIWYNFGWHKIAFLENEPLARSAIFMSMIGYLILFGDEIASLVRFDYITGSSSYFLSDVNRLRLVYLGLVLLACAYALYRWLSPRILRLARTPEDYVQYARHSSTLTEVRDMYQHVEASAHGPLTNYYEATDHDLRSFLRAAGYPLAKIDNDPLAFIDEQRAPKQLGRAAAIDQHFDFFQSLMLEYFAQVTRRQKPLVLFIAVLAGAGYLFLLLPSLDLFTRVVMDWLGLEKPAVAQPE